MRLPLLLAIALAAAGCATGPGDRLAELERARDRWAAQNISFYTLTLQRSCFCGGPMRVEVRVGEVAVTRTDLDTGQPVSAELAHLFPDITGLFAIVQQEIERPASALSVAYDSIRGFPRQITVDPIKNAIDDEYGYTITGFQPGL